jgi:hypothetical protein
MTEAKVSTTLLTVLKIRSEITQQIKSKEHASYSSGENINKSQILRYPNNWNKNKGL